jgi:hypothetical protein
MLRAPFNHEIRSMKHRSTLALLVFAALLASDRAEAGRPLQTEDAGVLERGDCEVELVAARERGEHPTLTSGRAQVGCGIGWRSQVAVAASRASGGGEREDSFGIGGKTWLRELTDEQTGITLAWTAGYVRPRGASTEREGAEVRAVVTHPIGPWLLHANLGWQRDSIEHRDSTVWGAAVERTGLGPVDAMFEFFGDDRERPWANAGLRWNVVPDRVMLDGSIGRQMGSDGRTLVTVGMKVTF